MLRYSLATLVSVSLGLTGFAQTKAPQEAPGLLSNNLGTVVSNAVPLPKPEKENPPITPVSANVPVPVNGPAPARMAVPPRAAVPVNMPGAMKVGTPVVVPPAVPVAYPAPGIVGHTTTCAAPATCETCPTPATKKGKSSCFDCFNKWFGYKPSPTPCECGPEPTPYRPPLIAYFSCKGTPFVVTGTGCSTGCGQGGCGQGVPTAQPGVVPHAVPGNAVPQAMPSPTPPPRMSPTISSSAKGGPIQPTGYSTTTLGTGIKPLSLYAPGAVKTSSMPKTEASPPLIQPSTAIPGYRRLGGTAVTTTTTPAGTIPPAPIMTPATTNTAKPAAATPITSTSLYPWK